MLPSFRFRSWPCACKASAAADAAPVLRNRRRLSLSHFERIKVDSLPGDAFRVQHFYDFSNHDGWPGEVCLRVPDRGGALFDARLDIAGVPLPVVLARRT